MSDNERRQAEQPAVTGAAAPMRRSAVERMAEEGMGQTASTTQSFGTQERFNRASGSPTLEAEAGLGADPFAMGGTQAPTGARPEAAPKVARPAPKRAVGIRRIHMTISKVDPFSALKLGFLVSVAVGVMIVVAMALIWFVLDGMHVFSQINTLMTTLGSEQLLQLIQYLEFGRWMSFAVIVAIMDVVLLTALSAVGALIYNLIAALVGGMRITVTDE